MNKREFFLGIGFIVALALLPALGLWQQARYRRAERATQAFIEAQQRAEAGEPGAAALFRQAQPEVRRNLLAGDFEGALQRLTALQDEDGTPATNKAHGKALTLNQLWPPHTPARASAQQVLRLMAQKQAQGYDLAGAQAALLQVANAARQGEGKKALAAFSTVALLTHAAPLRPGFGNTAAGATSPTNRTGAGSGALSGGPNPQRFAQFRPGVAGALRGPGAMPTSGALPPIRPEQMQQLEQSIQTFQLVLPQLMERATPAQRPLLQRLPPFLNALLAAYHAGKDIRPVMPFLQGFMAVGKRDPAAAAGLLDRAWIALNTAKPLPKGAPVSTVPQAQLKHPSLPAHLPLPPAQLNRPLLHSPRMSSGDYAPPGAMAALPQSQRILQMLDVIRKLPEPVYQQQRPQIARYIDGAMAGMGGRKNMASQSALSHAPRQFPAPKASTQHVAPTASPIMPATTSATLKTRASSVGTGAKLRLDFDVQGQIIDIQGLGHDLAPGLAPGGLALQMGDAPPNALRGTPTGNSSILTAILAGSSKQSDVRCSVRCEAAGRDVTLHLKTERKLPGAPATLILRIPLQAAGWHWDTGDTAQVIAVDGTYAITADGTTKLPMLTLRGTATRLALLAPSASAIAYDPLAGALELRFAVGGAAAATEHTLSFTISH